MSTVPYQLAQSNPNGIVAAPEGSIFNRVGKRYLLITGTVIKDLGLATKIFSSNYKNEIWYPSVTDENITYAAGSEIWKKVYGVGKTGWVLKSNQSILLPLPSEIPWYVTIVGNAASQAAGGVSGKLNYCGSSLQLSMSPGTIGTYCQFKEFIPSSCQDVYLSDVVGNLLGVTYRPPQEVPVSTPTLTATVTPTPSITPTPTVTPTVTPPATPPAALLYPNMVYNGGSPEVPFATEMEAIDAITLGSVGCIVVNASWMDNTLMTAAIGEGILNIGSQSGTAFNLGFGMNLVSGDTLTVNYNLAFNGEAASYVRVTLYDRTWTFVEEQDGGGMSGTCNLPPGSFNFTIPTAGAYFVVIDGGQFPDPPGCTSTATTLLASFAVTTTLSYMESLPMKAAWDNGGTTDYVICNI